MIYHVTLDFKRGPSFGPHAVSTRHKEDAIEQAIVYARGCGFDAPVKSAKAVPSEFASLTDADLRGEIDACHAIGANEAPYVAELERRAESTPTQTQQG